MKFPKVILLDVYETILDMSEVTKKVNLLFNSKRGYAIWLELLMEYCFVENCTSKFNDFNSIAEATLKMAARMLNTSVPEDKYDDIIVLLKQLPVKEGVQEGLSLFHGMDLRIAALTNASEKTVRSRMELTGLVSYFEMLLSAEVVKKYKPCCEVYQMAVERLEVRPEEILMISAHGWDIAGAANANLRTAYLEQSRQILYPLAPEPDFIGKDLIEIANQLKKLQAA